LPQLHQDVPGRQAGTGDLSGGRFARCRRDQRGLHGLLTDPTGNRHSSAGSSTLDFRRSPWPSWTSSEKQFIDVIHWTEDGDGVLAMRYPMQDFEIQYGAQLTVRESQIAVFVNEGQIADVFQPGQYR
jgi:hypothetical protein